jgi:hypothetical protein
LWWKFPDALLGTIGSLSSGAALAQDESTKLAPHNNAYNIHVFPTVTRALPLQTDLVPLVYNGGAAMRGGATPYLIFWLPAKLQNGKATTMSAHYQTVEKNMLGDYVAHGLYNNSTQYYQQVKGNEEPYPEPGNRGHLHRRH